MPIFIVFGLTRPGIESESSDLVADALFTRSPLGLQQSLGQFVELRFLRIHKPHWSAITSTTTVFLLENLPYRHNPNQPARQVCVGLMVAGWKWRTSRRASSQLQEELVVSTNFTSLV